MGRRFDESKIERADDGKFGSGSGSSGKPKGRPSPKDKPKRTPEQHARADAAKEKLANETARETDGIIDPVREDIEAAGMGEPIGTLQRLAVKLSFVGGANGAKEAVSDAIAEIRDHSREHARRVRDAVRDGVDGLPKDAARQIADAAKNGLATHEVTGRVGRITASLRDVGGGDRRDMIDGVTDAMRSASDMDDYHDDVQDALLNHSDDDIDAMIFDGDFRPATDDEGNPTEDVEPYRQIWRNAFQKIAEQLIGADNTDNGASKRRDDENDHLMWRIANADKIAELPTHQAAVLAQSALRTAENYAARMRGTPKEEMAADYLSDRKRNEAKVRATHEAAIHALRNGSPS